MTVKETIKKLEKELEGMRTRVDELRLKGSLGKMELRDKLTELKSALDPAYRKAKSKIEELAHEGADESKTMIKSLAASWDELRKTHKQLSEEADRERERTHEAKRKAD